MNEARGEVTLGSLCERITVGHVGPMANSYSGSGVPFLRSQDIGEFRISTSNIKFIPPEFDQKLKKSRLKAGDVAIVRTGYPGTAAVVPQELDGANCADLVILTPGPALDAWFVACLLNSAWGRGHVSGVLVGVAQQHFNVGAARDLKAVFPPLHIQRRVGSVIRAYCDLIEVNERRIAILEEMARRLFDEWFVRFRYPGHETVPLIETELGMVPEGWKPGTVADLTSFISRGLAPKYDDNAPSLVINQKCIRDQALNLSPARKQSKPIPQPKLISDGDILINSTGVGTLGRVAQLLGTLPNATVDTHVTIVRAAEEIDRHYFGLQLLLLQPHFERQGIGATGQTELSRTAIADTRIIIPTFGLASRFGRIAGPLRGQADLLRNQNNRLRATRDLLLPKLISGEIDVSTAEETFAEAAE